MIDKLLTENDVRKILNVSRTYMWRLRKSGKIKAVSQGSHRLYYKASDVENYIESL